MTSSGKIMRRLLVDIDDGTRSVTTALDLARDGHPCQLVVAAPRRELTGYLSTRLRRTPMMTKLGTVWVMIPIQMLRNRLAG
jgi:hypothetical protein